MKLIGKVPYFEFYLKDKQVVVDEEVANLISLYGEETKISSRSIRDLTEYFEGSQSISRETAYCLLKRWQDFKISNYFMGLKKSGLCWG